VFANNFQRIYHFHLKKCGGTSMNAWLEQHIEDVRCYDETWKRRHPGASELSCAWLSSVFFAADAVYDHRPLRTHAPPNTFCFTILRSPRDRLVSQVSDWRRLTPPDYSNEDEEVKQIFGDAAALSLRPFLIKQGRLGPDKMLDNYMVRALAASVVGEAALIADEPRILLDPAIECLESKFDVVGLTEREYETRTAIASRLGLATDREVQKLNVTNSGSKLRAEIEEAGDILEELTRYDALLYRRATELFEQRHVPEARRFDQESFEREYATAALQRLRPSIFDGDVVFSVRQPLIGSGFFGRDAPRTGECRIWTGPSPRSMLYMPVPAGKRIKIKLWVHAYASDRQRCALALRADGRTIRHEFQTVDGYRDLITAEVETTRDFVALTIDVLGTLDSAEAGSGDFDERRRGLSFDRYGWRLS
jgi:hypothetical protein